ncbi:MAG: DUF4105 domain-containing protein [Bacteroidaceae bacterium]|nr:DUF4105 domain-containing protein [Bacteroidaceae bacterium]
MNRIVSFFLFVFGTLCALSAEESGKIEVSVLTCSPGQEVYSLYGHTAIRVQDEENGTDLVFNYGIFDFNSKHFVWRFVLGQTDYMCMAVPYADFVREYGERGSRVTAQVLDLHDGESLKVRDYLMHNIRKENRVYRYNYLTNNCTTRVMDCIDDCVDGTIVYSWENGSRTYRQMMHEYTVSYQWVQDGEDLLLGSDVDTLLAPKATCFIPEYYSKALSGAVVRKEFKDTRRLVRKTYDIVEPSSVKVHKGGEFPLSPSELGWLFFGAGLLVLCAEHFSRRMFWLLDVVLMLAHGLAGSLILFVFLFSAHPTLDSNWLVAVLNPLPLVALPFVVKAAWNGRRTLWHHFMAVWLALFLLFIPWMPQQMGMLVVPLLATLLVRQVSYLLHYRYTGGGRTAMTKSGKNRKHRKTGKTK